MSVPHWVTAKALRVKKSHHKTQSTQSIFLNKTYFFVCLSEGERSFPTSFFPEQTNHPMRFHLFFSVCTGADSCPTQRSRFSHFNSTSKTLGHVGQESKSLGRHQKRTSSRG